MVLVCFTPTAAQAQAEQGAVFVSLHGGATQATVAGEDVTSSSFTTGYTGGISISYNINEALSAQIGLTYMQRGVQGLSTSQLPNVTPVLNYDNDEFTATYVEAPILLKLAAPIDAVRVRALGGLAFGNVVNATINGNERQDQLQSNPRFQDRLAPFDLSAVAGGEIALPISAFGEIALDGRYHFGIIELDNEGYDFSNRTISGTLSLRFAI
jgi:hypothetical protein